MNDTTPPPTAEPDALSAPATAADGEWIDRQELARLRAQDRRATELEERVALQRAVLDAMPDLVWLKDPQGVYLNCNPRFERLYGAREADILGRTDADFVPADLAEFFRANDRRALERDGPSVNEEELVFADDGHRELTHTIKTPVRDGDGRLLGVLGIGRDITALRRAEDEARQLFERNPAPMLVYARDDLQLLTVNEAFEALYGYPPDEARCLHLTDLYPTEDRAAITALAAQLVGLAYAGEWRHLRRDGSLLHVVAQSHDIHFDGRDCRLAVLTDVTPLHRNREREQRRLALLENLARGEPLNRLLCQLVLDYEAAYPDSLCSVLLLQPDGQRVRVGAAPSLPDFYNQALEGAPIGPEAGSCGASMYRRERVVVEDIATHPNWRLYRELAAAAGLGACWSQPVFGADGAVLGSFAVYHRQPRHPSDEELAYLEFSVQLASLAITHAQTAQQLRDSERRTREILDALPDPVWLKDPEGLFLACNRRFGQFVGRPPEQVRGHRGSELLAPDLLAPFSQADAEVQRTQAATSFEQWLDFAQDGYRGLFEVVKTPLHDEAGRFVGVLGVARDITLIKQGAQAIAEQERLVDTMFSQTTDAIVLLDAATQRIVTFNDAACQGLGYHREQFAALRPEDFQAEHSAAQIAENVRRALAGEAVSFETQHRRADGSLQFAAVTLRRLSYAGQPLLSAVWRDITDDKLHEARIGRLTQAYAVLGGVNEAIVRLHDLPALFAEACRIAVQEGGLPLAWIGQADASGQTLRPVAQAGRSEGYVESLQLSLEPALDVTAAAMHALHPVLVADIGNDPRTPAWREAALSRGLRSMAVFPIHRGTQVDGSLNVYADQPGYFDADLLRLFERLADNLGFALAFQAAEQARRHEQQLREQLIESVAGLFFAIDRQGRMVHWNRQVEQTTGYSHDEVAMLPATVHFETHERQRLVAAMQQAYAEGEVRLEAGLRCRDGRVLPHLFVARRLDTQPEPLLVGTAIDIGERVRSEQELARYRQRLEELVATRTAQLEDLNQRLHREDRRLRAMLALSRRAGTLDEAALWLAGLEEARHLSGSHAVCLFESTDGLTPRLCAGQAPPEGADHRAALAARALQAQAPVRHADPQPQARLLAVPLGVDDDADGPLRQVLCASGRERDYDAEDERELALVATDLHGIVQRRRTELALAQAKQAADAASQAKSAFLANMSHEIRTPMNAIVGFAHLLRRDPLTPRQRDHLDKIADASSHLLQLINDILDFSKVEAHKVELHPEPFELAASLARVADMVQGRLLHRPVTFTLAQERDCPAWVTGDRLRLEQVLLNLAGNAVKFTAQGRIELRVRCLERRPTGAGPDSGEQALLRFEVSDTGIGIAPEQLGRLFEAFEQADASTTRRFGGTGLGLAISQRLVTLMQGRIGVESRLGEGSLFWFELPLQLPAAAHSPPAPTQAKEASDPTASAGTARHAAATDDDALLRGAQVLLVEDNPINQEVARDLLTALGLQVEIAADGAQALRKVAARAFDLVLMDVQMPVMDGLQATAAIRRLPARKSVPIIAMTASAFAEDRRQCLEVGMDDFLMKPVEPEALRQCLLGWLQRRDRSDQAATRNAPSGSTGNGSAAQPPTTDADADAAAAFQPLADAAGFGVEAALRRLRGDTGLYRRTLAMFLRQHADDAERLRAALRTAAEPQGHEAACTRLRALAHALAGAAGTLGAAPLARAARALEAAALAQQPVAALDAAIAAVEAALQQALAPLRRLLAAAPTAGRHPADPAAVDAQALRRSLERLQQLLTLHDTEVLDAFDQARPLLTAALGTAATTRLAGCIHGFDFEAALAQVTQQLADAAPSGPPLDTRDRRDPDPAALPP